MGNSKLGKFSRIGLFIGAVGLVVVLFVPIWRIGLQSPKYPELKLLIYANDIKGDLAIVNGLNHYIGMHTIVVSNFFEFTILPYLIGFFAILFAIVSIQNSKKYLYALFIILLIFGVVAIVYF